MNVGGAAPDATVCPVCAGADTTLVLSLPSLPVLVNSQVRPDEAPAVPRGDMELVVCRSCGHLFNRAYDPALLDYDATYENTLHYSPSFQEHARSLAARLVDEHHLAGAAVAELGSGPGHFLAMLADAGVGSAAGFDPSYDVDRLGAPSHPAVTISTDLFPADGSAPVEFAFSQHVLEHLEHPVEALRAQAAAVAPRDGVVYSEVPNGAYMIDHCTLWDLIYEHYSYFVPTSLRLLHERAGLAVSTIDTAYEGQFLWCEATLRADGVTPDDRSGEVAATVRAAIAFGAEATRRLETARHELDEMAAAGPVALWGAGSKGMTYLNLIDDGAAEVLVVDVNPRKAGWGVPGTSRTIVGPDALRSSPPATVLVANPIYRDEITSMLADLGVHPEVRPMWE